MGLELASWSATYISTHIYLANAHFLVLRACFPYIEP